MCRYLLSNNIDTYGDNIPKSQKSNLLCNYLEKLNDHGKVLYIEEVNKTFWFTKKVLCIHSLSLNQITRKRRLILILVTIDL